MDKDQLAELVDKGKIPAMEVLTALLYDFLGEDDADEFAERYYGDYNGK